jgi:protease-4
MPFNHTISAILRGRWLLDKSWADQHLPLVLSMLQGNNVSFVERSGNAVTERPFVIDPQTMQRFESVIYNWREERYVPNPNIPENCVGVLPISGPITKYNGDCGEPGAIQRNTWLMDMKRRSNISSVILMLDTPGGESRAASTSVSLIKNFGKPILSYVDGMCASLGVWYSSATDEVYFGNEMDELGSVGSYCTIFDFKGYFEKEGIKIHEIYAPQSVDKNKDYRDALQGDYSGIEADLKLHVDAFISFVKQNRGEKAAAHASEWRSGKMFYAKEAVSMGLADGIKPFDQVVSKAAWLAKRKR